jgi:hypothetical protein
MSKEHGPGYCMNPAVAFHACMLAFSVGFILGAAIVLAALKVAP